MKDFSTMTELKSVNNEQNATQQQQSATGVPQQSSQSNSSHQNNSSTTSNSMKPLKKQTSALDNIAFHLGIGKSDSNQADDRNLYVTLLCKLMIVRPPQTIVIKSYIGRASC